MSRASARAFFLLLASGGAAPGLFSILGELPTAYIGASYDEELALDGLYTAPVAVALLAGELPPGLAAEPGPGGDTVRIHGTPLGAVAIQASPLPAAVVGSAYTARIQVDNAAAGAATITVLAGAMPTWALLTWHDDTNEIEIYGTVTE